MRIFIRTSSIAEQNPQIMASHQGDVPADLYGPDMTMLEVPDTVSLAKKQDESFPRLPDDWRERFTEPALQAEAKRRVDETLSPLEQLTTLHELVDLVIQHGSDVSQWPDAAKARKAELDEAWSHIRAIKAHAQSVKSITPDLASDKNWPARMTKKIR